MVFVGRKNDLCSMIWYYRSVFKVILAYVPHPQHCWFRFTHWSHNPLMVCDSSLGKHSSFLEWLLVMTSCHDFSLISLSVWRIATWLSKACISQLSHLQTVCMVLGNFLCHTRVSQILVCTQFTWRSHLRCRFSFSRCDTLNKTPAQVEEAADPLIQFWLARI